MRIRRRSVALLVSLAVVAGIVTSPRAEPRRAAPLVIGHRGTAGYLPDHTLEGYALAIELGADFVEPDLVATKDGHLIARHEPNLIATTDVSRRPEFAGRKRVAIIDGAPDEGWFASDFTLREIKTLRAVQPFAERPQQFNGRFEIPTLEEIIDLVKRKSREAGRTIGIYPETKHPTYHESIGLPLEGRLARILHAAGWDRRDSPVFLQSFEPSSLKKLRRLTSNRSIQLIDANDVNPDGTLDFTAPFDRPYDWTASGDPRLLARRFDFLTTDEGLREVKKYADGIGPWKRYIVSTTGTGEDSSRALLPPSDLVARAHRHGLLVHTWTFRNEPRRLAADYKANPVSEILMFFELGVDGIFTDFTDTGVVARFLFLLSHERDFASCLVHDDCR